MNKKELSVLFDAPGAEYRGKPFWSWNGELREEELKRQVGVMKEMGLGGFFMHSRAGLITEYLGDEWFDLINATADEGEKLGMEAWLYDEDRWPSGCAGGKVTVDPQYRMKSLVLFELTPDRFTWEKGAYENDTLFAFAAKTDGINCADYVKLNEGDDLDAAFASLSGEGENRVLRFAIVPDACSSSYNGTTYIDTMSYKAVYKFIEMTHEEYAKRCGDRLGRSIKGIFTDEPHRGVCLSNLRTAPDGTRTCGMAWTDDIFEQFALRYGYDCTPILPELFYRCRGEAMARVKLNYVDLADNLFVERFAMPINQWCKAHSIEFTGHVLHEDMLTCQTVPHGSLMRFYPNMGVPGIDLLTEHNSTYFIVKQLASAARQYGQKMMLSELYGCTGWNFNFKSHKYVGDWQTLFGINLRCQHLSWYTMEGESKRDYPASILHQSPWYKDYSYVETYFARFGALMSEGKPVCDTLVLNPIESVWAQIYLGWANWIIPTDGGVQKLEDHYRRLSEYLIRNHIDYDYGEEQMMHQMAEVITDEYGKAALRIGKAVYHTVIVSGMQTIRPSTLDILRRFMDMGGRVIFAGKAPGYVDAVKSSEPAELAAKGVNIPFDENILVAAVNAGGRGISILKENGETAHEIICQQRMYDDLTLAALLNTDRKNGRKNLTLSLDAPASSHAQIWCAETGEKFDADSFVTRNDGRFELTVSLEAAGTLFVIVTPEKEELPGYRIPDVISEDVLRGEYSYKLDEKNVCVLDFLRWKWDEASDIRSTEWHSAKEALHADREIRGEVGIEKRGGGMLQPWFAKLNYKEKYGDITLEYTFNAETLPKGEVFLAGERPEYNDYYLNGVKLTAGDINDFWVDNCLRRLYIPEGTIKEGVNTVTVKTNFMRTTNVESVYLVGDFGVRLNGNISTLTALPEKIGNGNLAEYDLPFYTGAVTYILPASEFEKYKGQRVIISPEKFTGGLCKVTTSSGVSVLAWDPYEADITEAVEKGEDILFTVVGTRRNTFGPLHVVPAIQGAYGPESFVTSGRGWSDDYMLIDSALTGVKVRTVK